MGMDSLPDVFQSNGICEATGFVWRKPYASLAIAEIRRLRQLEKEARTPEHWVLIESPLRRQLSRIDSSIA